MSTGIKDVDLEILLRLEDKDLIHLFQTNKYFNSLGYNSHFWRKKIIAKFGNNEYLTEYEIEDWRELYINIYKDLKKYENYPISLLFGQLDWYVIEPIPSHLYIYFLNITQKVFHFPLDSYILHSIPFTVNFPTPYRILKKIQELANSPVTMEDYEKLLDLGDSVVEKFSRNDILQEKVKYYSIVGKHFSGFYDSDKQYVALLDF